MTFRVPQTAEEQMMQQEGSHDLVRQLSTIGDQIQTLARGMDGQQRIPRQRLEDLQAMVAQLTDIANELEQYVDAAGGATP